MRILITNDDGIDANGIRALIDRLSPNHTLYVIAPDTQRSAVSKSLTLYAPLRAEPRKLEGHPEVLAYAISGTPVDCVRLALGNLVPEMPDLCISGINIGHNLGTDTLYSGTCGGACEAAIRGIPSVAMSCCSFQPKHMDTAARVAEEMISFSEKYPLPFGTFYNVNVPDVPYEQLRGIRKTELSVVEYETRYEERKDPIGRPYYWAPRRKLVPMEPLDTDERWTSEGYVTLTPLTYNNVCGTYLNEHEWKMGGP